MSPTPVDASRSVLGSIRASPYMSSWADMWLGEGRPDKENEGGIADVADKGGIADVTLEGGIAHQ
eukprot:4254571-Karenia_brevis.AAC.1